MIWHPLALSIVMIDAIALLLLFKAAATAVRTAADWSPASSAEKQIALETAEETGALAARAILGLLALSSLTLVIATSNVFPGLVPGAMCGTGVLQATGGAGAQAFFFKFLSLGIFCLWFQLDRLGRSVPEGPLAQLNARLLLLAAPFAALAVIKTFEALNRLDAHTPVDCCALVYDQFGAAGNGVKTLLSDRQLAGFFTAFTGILVVLGAAALAAGKRWLGFFSGGAAVFSLIWGPLSAVYLVRVLSAYTYEVLHHHCPWCLFLPEHRYAGFALFGFLGLGMFQAPSAWLHYRVAAENAELAGIGCRAARRALAAMLVFIFLFVAAAIWPALSWRIRYGV